MAKPQEVDFLINCMGFDFQEFSDISAQFGKEHREILKNLKNYFFIKNRTGEELYVLLDDTKCQGESSDFGCKYYVPADSHPTVYRIPIFKRKVYMQILPKDPRKQNKMNLFKNLIAVQHGDVISLTPEVALNITPRVCPNQRSRVFEGLKLSNFFGKRW